MSLLVCILEQLPSEVSLHLLLQERAGCMRVYWREYLQLSPHQCLLLPDCLLEVLYYGLELLDGVPVLLGTPVIEDANVPLDAYDEAFALIFVIPNDAFKVKEVPRDLVALELGVRATERAAEEDGLPDLPLLHVVYQVLHCEE